MWLDRFSRVGDLLHYLKRFDVSHNDPTYVEMKAHGLLTFEDIVGEFSEKFDFWAHDCSRISDFIIGHGYSVFDILILARNYDTRSGGMFVLEADDKPTAVVIKATLSDGHYPNQWLKDGTRLKYYLKSISGMFGEHFKPNKAILENHQIPIVTFTRDSKAHPFLFRGIFQYEDIVYESENAKAFILKRSGTSSNNMMTDARYAEAILASSVEQAKLRSQQERFRRLAKAKKRPVTYSVTTTVFSRNPDVIAEALHQAQGICQGCSKPAPFLRSSDGAPYLEVHHRIPLAIGGEDTVTNAIALCPNCHRERHFGIRHVVSIPANIPVLFSGDNAAKVEVALNEAITVQIGNPGESQ